MGTNYYTEEDPPCAHCGRGGTEFHIGKSSAGWAFTFAPYPEHGLTTWAAWKQFLAPRVIKNEYGDVVPLDDLAELVEAKKELWTHVTAPRSAWGPHERLGHLDDGGYWFSRSAEFS